MDPVLKTPRTWFRLDRVWYLDKKYRRVSHQAVLLHLGLIGLSVNNGANGAVDQEDADTVCLNLRLGDALPLWEELLAAGLLQAEDGGVRVNNFERWQLSGDDKQRLRDAGAAGGQKSGQARREKSASAATSTDGFNRDAGFLEATAAYPPGYNENADKMRQAYNAEVSSADDHANVMRGIKYFAEMFHHRVKSEGQAVAMKYRTAFTNFLSRQEYQLWQASRLTQAEGGLDIGPPDEVQPLETV